MMDIQTIVLVVNSVTGAIVGAGIVYIGRALAQQETEIKDWIRNQNYITRDQLDRALDAFADRFRNKLLEHMNGENGFVRKGTCAMVEEHVAEKLDSLSDRLGERQEGQ